MIRAGNDLGTSRFQGFSPLPIYKRKALETRKTFAVLPNISLWKTGMCHNWSLRLNLTNLVRMPGLFEFFRTRVLRLHGPRLSLDQHLKWFCIYILTPIQEPGISDPSLWLLGQIESKLQKTIEPAFNFRSFTFKAMYGFKSYCTFLYCSCFSRKLSFPLLALDWKGNDGYACYFSRFLCGFSWFN